MKKTLITLLSVIMSIGVNAQRISFDKSSIQTQPTQWKTPVSATYKFTNKDGKVPLVIKDVDAGCGCIDVKWTTTALEKGEQGEITVTYDARLLGKFDRVIDVYTNSSDKPTQIRFKGNVTNKEGLKTVDDIFPYNIGEIWLSKNEIVFPDINNGDSATVNIDLLNETTTSFTPQLMHLPGYITVDSRPSTIGRSRRGSMVFTLHGNDDQLDYGLNQTEIFLSRFPGDVVSEENSIPVSIVLLPEIVKTEDGAYPVFEVSTTDINLGKIGKKSKVTGEVVIKNNGQSKLMLNNIQPFNTALSITLPKQELAPGESTTLKISLEQKYLTGKGQTKVLIITNDPNHQKEVINVNFEL